MCAKQNLKQDGCSIAEERSTIRDDVLPKECSALGCSPTESSKEPTKLAVKQAWCSPKNVSLKQKASIIKLDVDTATLSTLDGASFSFVRDVVACIGVFDGIHKGHKDLLFASSNYAQAHNKDFVVITFEKDPDEFFCARKNKAFQKLVSNKDRIEKLVLLTNAPVLILPCTSDFFALEPLEFLELLQKAIPLFCIQVGQNFHFGAHGSGSTKDMFSWANDNNIECVVHNLSTFENAPVSSTRIRSLIDKDDILTAELLKNGWLASVKGEVKHGRGQGTGMGVATANLQDPTYTKNFGEHHTTDQLEEDAPSTKNQPKEGVYAGVARVNNKSYLAAINVGKAASFKDAVSDIEAHLLDFSGQLYGENISLYLVKFLRNQRVFDNNEELIATIKRDIENVRELFCL